MANPWIPFDLEGGGVLRWPSEAHVVDDMEDAYLDWRDRADEVVVAYERWIGAPLAEQARRYAAYEAALDQEESAAVDYDVAVAVVRHWLERGR